MAKVTGAVSSNRTKLLSELLIRGISREEIIQYCAKNWNIKERQSDSYIAKAKEIIEQSVKRKIEYDYAKAVRRYEDLYKLSLEKNDYRTALSVNKELTTLQGLFKQQIEHSGEIQFICNVPD